jgi:hypothetical protein
MSVTRPQTVLAGATFTETVAITNPGGSTTGQVLVTIAGGGADSICETSPLPQCAEPNNGLSIGSIGPGATVTASFDVKTTSDLGNGVVDSAVRASDGTLSVVPEAGRWVMKLDPNAQLTDVGVEFVSTATPSYSLFNEETVWKVTNHGSTAARGVVFRFQVTPSPDAMNLTGDVVGGTPLLLPYLQPGASDTVIVDTHTTAATTESVTIGHNEGDPDSSNDTASTSFTPPSSGGSGGGGGGGGSLTAPPYHFVDQLLDIAVDNPTRIQFLACPDGLESSCTPGSSPSTALVAGALPAGMQINDTEIFGVPFLAGSYTFTLQTTLPALYTPIEKQYTLVVDPLRHVAASPGTILPSRTRTPGVTNPAVRQATIKKTICVSGWAATDRPPLSYTNTLKLKQMKQYGETGSPSSYEEDQFIPLELGGAPKNAKNLWPEPHSQSKHSDPLETSLKRKVCAGTLTLAAARKQIATYKRAHG